MSYRKCAFLFLVLSVVYRLPAQNNDSTVFSFPDDLDSVRVDSFFRRYSLDINTCRNPELYLEVYRWYRTCYRYGGSGGKGIDCSGFTNMLYEKIYGIKIPRASYLIYDICQPLGKREEKREGDFVFFKIRKKRVSHVGVYLANNKFAHATTQAGVIISDLDEPYYRKYFFKAGRLKEKLPEAP
jgi:lipoprotein Spr